MFSKRSDGRFIKGLDPIFRLIPHIMPTRAESQVMCKSEMSCSVLDDYIKDKRNEGIEMSYMSIILAAYLRMLAHKPQLNRFIVNGRIFARDDYVFTFVVKKALKIDAEEMLLKLHFNGTETVYDVNRIIIDEVRKIKTGSADNATDKLASRFMSLPHGIVRFAVNFLMWLDRIGLMPPAVIEASPFHTSMFFSNVKSIKLNYIYHHLYNFGTASVFISLGRTRDTVSIDRSGEMDAKKVYTLGITLDERICDGLYFSKSLILLNKYLNNPQLLESPLDSVEKDID